MRRSQPSWRFSFRGGLGSPLPRAAREVVAAGSPAEVVAVAAVFTGDHGALEILTGRLSVPFALRVAAP